MQLLTLKSIYTVKNNKNKHRFNGLFSRPTWLTGTRIKSNWILMKQEMMGVAVASAGPHANHLHLDQTANRASTSSLIFCRPDALPDNQPTVSKKVLKGSINIITSDYATWFTAGGAIMKSSELSSGENRIALRQLLKNRKLRHLWRHNLGSRWKLQKWLQRILVLVRSTI